MYKYITTISLIPKGIRLVFDQAIHHKMINKSFSWISIICLLLNGCLDLDLRSINNTDGGLDLNDMTDYMPDLDLQDCPSAARPVA